jgi:DNA-binding NarL/FixJ family response regulator
MSQHDALADRSDADDEALGAMVAPARARRRPLPRPPRSWTRIVQLRADADLSPRQREVLTLRAQGLALKVIGMELDLRPSTVAGHLLTAQRRLGLEPWELGCLAVEDTADAPGAAPMHVLRKASFRLSDAEIQVLKHVFEGWSNQRIAFERKRSVRTIANQVASGFRKLDVRSRAELFARFPSGRMRADDADALAAIPLVLRVDAA